MAMSDTDKVALTLALAGTDAGGKDAALIETAYLPLAKEVVLSARNPFAEDLTDDLWETRYDRLQCEIAADLFFRRGVEGQTVHNENGVNRTWGSAGVSKHLMQRILPKGKAPK
jgi:hypothetical protein